VEQSAMKTGVVICGPDVNYGPLALFSGTFEEKIVKASDAGYQGVELMVRDADHLDWQNTKGIIERAGLGIPQVVTGELFGADGLRLICADVNVMNRAQQRMYRMIDFAAYTGTMVNIGRVRGHLEEVGGGQIGWKLALDRIGMIVDYASCKKVRVCIEPLNRYETDFINTVGEGLRFIKDLKMNNLGLMLDLFHMNIEEVSIEAALEEAGDSFWHLHIADSHRRYPGSGHMVYEPIFATLKTINYQGYISAELLPLPNPDVAALKSIAFLNKQLS
jgi:sugar phosphate isomerase/epimerase